MNSAADDLIENSNLQEPMERALDQMENAFIRVETKLQKQRLKTIKEKKEDQKQNRGKNLSTITWI